ncbi:MAG: TetR family transcriptional regulator [Actinoallomurus sp.]
MDELRRRTGRRPGDSGTRRAIIEAARAKFAERGFEGATIRVIAQEAKVDPALIHHFFRNKEGVFSAAIGELLAPDTLLPPVLEPGLDGLGERLVRMFLGVWESGEDTHEALIATIRSTVSNADAADLLRRHIILEFASGIGSLIEREDSELRASLVGSQLVGLMMLRYVSHVEPLASMDPEAVVAYIAPTLNHYLTEDLGQRSS